MFDFLDSRNGIEKLVDGISSGSAEAKEMFDELAKTNPALAHGLLGLMAGSTVGAMENLAPEDEFGGTMAKMRGRTHKMFHRGLQGGGAALAASALLGSRV